MQHIDDGKNKNTPKLDQHTLQRWIVDQNFEIPGDEDEIDETIEIPLQRYANPKPEMQEEELYNIIKHFLASLNKNVKQAVVISGILMFFNSLILGIICYFLFYKP